VPSSSCPHSRRHHNRPVAGTLRRPVRTARRALPSGTAHYTGHPLRNSNHQRNEIRTLHRLQRASGRARSVTVDVVEAEGDGEGEAVGVAAVPAAGPDLSHLQSGRGETGERREGNGCAVVGGRSVCVP
jgi:hypothetical protein